MEYRYEVIADDSGKWARNGVTYSTEVEAEAGARDLMSRWMAVREWRVVPVEAEGN